jgi:hypothetical protein
MEVLLLDAGSSIARLKTVLTPKKAVIPASYNLY